MIHLFQSLKEIRKFIHRGASSHDVVKVCPICLRTTIELLPNKFLSFIIPSTYYCHTCQYEGPIVAEIERKEYQKIKFDEFKVSVDQRKIF